MKTLRWLTAAALLLPLKAGAECLFVSVVDVGFGAYDTFSGAALDSTGSVVYHCDLAVTLTISQGGANSYNPRGMSKGSGTLLNYNLYLEAARSNVWGDGTGGTSNFSAGGGNPENVTLTVYGRVPALQNVAVGSYSDSLVITMNF